MYSPQFSDQDILGARPQRWKAWNLKENTGAFPFAGIQLDNCRVMRIGSVPQDGSGTSDTKKQCPAGIPHRHDGRRRLAASLQKSRHPNFRVFWIQNQLSVRRVEFPLFIDPVEMK